ncbi:hypothetical protein [Nocardia cerradoensis]|uniref:Tail assembly chaperone n=1 Tax=Nocardia cerradoensis TaxID=85688 RepID=A0A231GST7_9NOCA|nr:hypothetical protein [Nocardia cerradoensis]NKY48050.1 hypothetical protein [Nocardia cerradoensis]OXR39690.1 hypothetical protein B7C42_08236 [Nocardia cerradoensis]
MATTEPPHGIEDLAGQVNDINVEEERAQIAAERAKVAAERAALEHEQALVRQRRVREDQQQPTVLEPSGEPVAQEPAPRSYTPAVVDSDGGEFEVDVETGEVIRDSFGQPIPKWKHQTVELDGEIIQVRKPAPQALQAFSMAISKYAPPQIQMDMANLFVKNHISPLSYGRLLARMMDPEESFTMEDFGRLIEKIATLDTARPIEPSRP